MMINEVLGRLLRGSIFQGRVLMARMKADTCGEDADIPVQRRGVRVTTKLTDLSWD